MKDSSQKKKKKKTGTQICFSYYFVGVVVFLKITSLQGPHIASVTMAAYECNSLDFPEPPYPERF